MQRTYRASFLLTSIVLLGGLIGISAQAPAPAAAVPAAATVTRRVDYNWDVRPILSDYCFRCHGPDEKARQAGLRLDHAEGAYAALRRPGTFAIVPGKPAESQMIFRITHANAAVRMPPQVANKVLSPQQIEILRAWIAQGAEYKPHWAFTAPRKAAVPAVPAAPSVLNEIDRFVQTRLARDGLKLSPPADKETLINRVTLTLTGLPPTLAEVDAFLKDTSPQAYEKLVDRLLASTAYGEHVGGQWLDIARYSESDGFLDDTHDRLLWPYRDWVIAALNRNMPFDQFATWQLAGDLLPSHTKEQLLATAFLRAGKRSTENGAIDEEYRVEYAVDRAMTVGTGFLAMTVGCARCHDHKYDPIPTKDFYSLTGFFNSTDEPGFYAPGRSGTTPGPGMLWADDAQEKEIAALRAAIVKAEAAYDAARQVAAQRAAAHGRRAASEPGRPAARPGAVACERSAGALSIRDHRADSGGREAGTGAAGAAVAAAARARVALASLLQARIGHRLPDDAHRDGAPARLVEHRAADGLVEHDGSAPGRAVDADPARRHRREGVVFRRQQPRRPRTGRRLFRADTAVQHRSLGEAGRQVRRVAGRSAIARPTTRGTPAISSGSSTIASGSILRTTAPAMASRFTRRSRCRSESGRTSRSRTTDRAGRRASRCTSTGSRPMPRSTVTTSRAPSFPTVRRTRATTSTASSSARAGASRR